MPPQEPSAPLFLTYQQAAERLGVTAHWLRQAVAAERVAHSRLSAKVVRFTESDIESIREASRVEPKAPPKKSGPTPSRRKRAS
jgi:hypothetical protein